MTLQIRDLKLCYKFSTHPQHRQPGMKADEVFPLGGVGPQVTMLLAQLETVSSAVWCVGSIVGKCTRANTIARNKILLQFPSHTSGK